MRHAYARPCDRAAVNVAADPIAVRRFRRRSRAALRHSGVLDHGPSCRRRARGDVRAVSPKGAMGLMQIMPETWAGLRRVTASAPILSIRTTTLSPVQRISASCTIATARPASSRPTMPDPRAGRITSRPAGRYRRRREPMSPSRADRRRTSGRRRDVLAAIIRSWTEASLFPARSTTALSAARQVQSRRRRSSHRAARRRRIGQALAPQSEGLFVALSNRERRNESRPWFSGSWRALARFGVRSRVGKGTQPTDGKGKGRPSARLMWLV